MAARLPQAWRLSRNFPEDQESIPKPAILSFSLGGDCLHVRIPYIVYFFGLPSVKETLFRWQNSNRELHKKCYLKIYNFSFLKGASH